jgi:hypothetical protein
VGSTSSEAAADTAFETTVITAIKARRIRFMGHVARMGESNAEFWSENVKIRRGQLKYRLEGGRDLTARRYHDVAFIRVKTTVDGLHKMRGVSLLSAS